jgi:nucleotide-binding universal stress UspA family protein
VICRRWNTRKSKKTRLSRLLPDFPMSNSLINHNKVITAGGLNMFDRILIPLDGSQSAETVIPYVKNMGLYFGSRLQLIRVCESDIMVSDCRYYLEGVAGRLRSLSMNSQTKPQSDIEFSVIPGSGNPSDSILNSAHHMQADLIIRLSGPARQKAGQ